MKSLAGIVAVRGDRVDGVDDVIDRSNVEWGAPLTSERHWDRHRRAYEKHSNVIDAVKAIDFARA